MMELLSVAVTRIEANGECGGCGGVVVQER